MPEAVPGTSGKISAPKRSTGDFREPRAGAGRTTGVVPAASEKVSAAGGSAGRQAEVRSVAWEMEKGERRR